MQDQDDAKFLRAAAEQMREDSDVRWASVAPLIEEGANYAAMHNPQRYPLYVKAMRAVVAYLALPTQACTALLVGKHPCVLPAGHDGQHSIRRADTA